MMQRIDTRMESAVRAAARSGRCIAQRGRDWRKTAFVSFDLLRFRFIAALFWLLCIGMVPAVHAEFTASAVDSNNAPVAAPYCDNVTYTNSPHNGSPGVTSTKYCLQEAPGSPHFKYGWSHSSTQYPYWTGVDFSCGYYSCRSGSLDYSVGTIYPTCPANSTYVGNAVCRCNEGYTDNPQTGNSCSVLIETNLAEAPQHCPTCVGNPVYPLTGAKKERAKIGVTLAGLELVLTYDSTRALRPAQSGNASALVEPSPFGTYWKSSFHRRLQVSPGLTKALLSRGDGQILTFAGNGSGTFSGEGYNANKLVTITGGYRFTDVATGIVETFDSSGKLLTLATTSGSLLTFNYAASGLASVEANDGRAVRFIYDANNLVSKILTPDWSAIQVGYDANKNLATLTWPDTKVTTYVYENTSFPWALTGKVDENSSRYSTFSYDSSGRAVTTEHSGVVDKFSVSYGAAPVWMTAQTFDSANNIVYRTHSWEVPSGTVVTQPNGEVFALEAQSVLGVPSVSSQTQVAGSGTTAAASATTYDGAGNVASRDDFAGVRTCYVYDTTNRETVRVEGLSTSIACSSVTGVGATLPTGARKTSTAWHPDWKLAAEVSEPLRKTTYVYHGRADPFNGGATANCTTAAALPSGQAVPVLCKEVVQALLANGSVDSAVAARTRSYTYDSAGRLLNDTDPNGRTTARIRYSDTSFSGSSSDSDFGKVALLLHGNGTNGSTTLVDDGLPRPAFTLGGNTNVSTSQSKFGGASIVLDGTGDYILFPNASDFNFGAADFTIEMFVYKTGSNPNSSRLWGASTDSTHSVELWIGPTGSFSAYASTNGSWNHGAVVSTISNGQWYHLAVVRSGGSLFAFVDGVRTVVSTTLGTASLYMHPSVVAHTLGGQPSPDRGFNGYLDDVRITKGKARYTANFTVASQEFANRGPGAADTGHTAGDVESITNPAAHATQFNLYDPAGRVRQMTDPKGVVTDITYTSRGWVSTMTVTPPGGSARTTTYTYDDAGQLTGAALPDGTSLAYSYDAAHRLVGATDTRGNTVAYTLDSAGNRTAEEVRDSSNNLQRSISRSFDALNRLQQVTGAVR